MKPVLNVVTAVAATSMASAVVSANHRHVAHPRGMPIETTPTSLANVTGPNCGLGYTYCGYILKEHQNFDEETIVAAYCAGGLCDAETGTAITDPLQALFVCLPDGATPRNRLARRGDGPAGPVKVELLCACSGTAFAGGENVCLNPDGDHIGRCSTPCVNYNY